VDLRDFSFQEDHHLSALLAELRRIAEDLNQLNLRWALVGGLAYSVHAEPRTARDVDVALAVSGNEEMDLIADALIKKGYWDKQILFAASPVRRMGGRIMVPSQRPYAIPLNLLSSSSGIEHEVVEHATALEILPNLTVPVASRGYLLAMKVLSQNHPDRLHDKTDLNALILNSDPQDVKTARKALELITSRGFNHDRNLLTELEGFLAAASKGSPLRHQPS